MKTLFSLCLCLSFQVLACKQTPFAGSLTDLEQFASHLGSLKEEDIKGQYFVGMNLVAAELIDQKGKCRVEVFSIKRHSDCRREFNLASLKKSYQCRL